jgi:hypothetical protein
MIEDRVNGPCEVCGYWNDDCVCPDCPVCGEQGRPGCYETPPHIGVYTKAQLIGQAKFDIAESKAAMAEHYEYFDWVQCHDQSEMIDYKEDLINQTQASLTEAQDKFAHATEELHRLEAKSDDFMQAISEK